MARLLAVAAAAAVIAVALGSGVDVSAPVMPSDWSCIVGQGFPTAIIRGYQSFGQPDPNCPHTRARTRWHRTGGLTFVGVFDCCGQYNAWQGGVSDVWVYMFPCYSCGDPADQVKSTISYLQGYNVTVGGGSPNGFSSFWFDIEGPQYWSSNPSDNQNFMQGLIDAGNDLGLSMGVYTSASQWGPIMDNWTGASSLPLWYAHYDNDPGFDDFSPFGGWSSPTAKQYNGDTTLCGVGVDLDYF